MGIPKRGLMACASCGAIQGESESLKTKIKALTSALADAKRDLEKYGSHNPGCKIFELHLTGTPANGFLCTCGFDKALKRLVHV